MGNECQNCGHIWQLKENYCASCGQKTAIHRLDFHALGHEIVHYFTHIERNIFALIAQLSIQPGVVAREYVAGKRKKYFPPVTFFLIVVGFLVVSISLAHTFDIAFVDLFYKSSKIKYIQYFITSKINWLYFFLTLLYPLFYRIFYFRQKYNYVEHLVASFYWQGMLLLFFIIFLIPLIYFNNSLESLYLAFWIYIIVQCSYYAYGYYQIFDKKGVIQFGVNVFISIITNFLIFALCVLLLRLYYFITIN